MLRTLFLVFVLVTTPAIGQVGPSFDCGKAQSATEEIVCEDPELAALDRLVADRYGAALEAARQLSAGAQQAEDELRAYQRGWVKGRDDCWKADDLKDCVRSAYLRREAELVTQWMLEEPASITTWVCNGNPANEVVTYFYETTLPSVRFERGDTIDTGVLMPSSAGARYEGSFGRSISITEEAASYREADPDGTSYECVSDRQ